MRVPLFTALVISQLASPIFANPASTEYVNARIKEASDTLDSRINAIEKTVNNIPIASVHTIGEIYQGGVVFWLDDTRQHGLIAANIDATEGAGVSWQNGESGDKVTNAMASGIKAGWGNTQLIISQQTIDDQQGQFAALSAFKFHIDKDGLSPCQSNSDSCISDWYLPSIFELKLMRHLKLSDSYWSSNELNVNQAYGYSFSQNKENLHDKAENLKVRPIHAF